MTRSASIEADHLASHASAISAAGRAGRLNTASQRTSTCFSDIEPAPSRLKCKSLLMTAVISNDLGAEQVKDGHACIRLLGDCSSTESGDML